MASSCSSSYVSSQETTNFARICRIVVDVLRDVLWQVLTHEVPPADLPNRVQTNQNKLRKLDVKINTWLLGISPSSPDIPKAEKFDVSSLYTLIRNLCSTVPTPSTQWGHTPPPGGTALGDDIERVREFRNTLFGHATQAKIDTTDFNNICTDIKDVVSRFDVYFSSVSQAMKCNFKSEIDTILTCCMDKTLEDAYIDRMKEIAILSDDFDDVKQQVGDVKQQVDIVIQQVGDTNKKVDIVNQQVGDTDKKVDIVNQQVGDTNKKVDIVNQQVGDIKQQVDDINKNLEILQSKVDVVNKECIEIKEALKMNPVIVEKSRIGGQEDLQTKEFGLVIDQSNQPISLETIPSQSSQVGEQMQGVEMEASQIVEHYDDPEADKQEPVIPVEIMQMDEGSIQMFKEALRDRTVKVYNIRVMIVGQYGVGKTTLCKRLLGDDVDINERKSTDGIDVHVQRCRVSMATGEWVKQDKDAEQADKLQLYCKLLNDQGQGRDIGDEQAGYSKSMHQAETTLDVKDIQKVEPTHFGRSQKSARSSSTESDLSPFDESDLSSEDQSSDEDDKGLKASSKVMQGDKKKSFSSISKEDLNQILEESIRNADMSNNEATVKNIIQFLNENADKLVRSRDEYAPLAMWDFAGQYVYYTTHQTFLTQRAIYLLVIDLTQQATDLVNDECFFDIEGKKERQVHDLVEIWMNSIHSCASSLESCSPPVILVGTHMDKIDQDIQQEKSENIFQQIRYTYLRGRPARLHLADMDFSMDNTFKDPKIKDLQKKIVELASQQLHWGESIPGRWLLLEEQLMSLKAKGIKVIPYHFLEKMNQEGDVRIESKEELDLFLKFEHDIGNILYFSTEELWEWIVLEPQWLIKAMKSLITADMFILRKHPQAEREWHQFKEEGKLTQKLLDIIWSKEHDPDLHNHKELILSLMEHLNIVARPIITRPMLFMKDADKVEDFFLAPCMLRQTTPPEVISPDVKAERETSSVLCFVFMGKFLPPPIFHRLLAVCVAKWPILKRRGTNQIFCGCGIFEIDHHYRLTLYFKSYVIFARITLVAAKHQTLDPEVCIPVRKFINDSLYKILGNLRQNLNFELFIQCRCPQSVGDSLDSLFSVEKLHNIANLTCNYHDDHSVESQSLLKYWFMNEEHPSEDTFREREREFRFLRGGVRVLGGGVREQLEPEFLRELEQQLGGVVQKRCEQQ